VSINLSLSFLIFLMKTTLITGASSGIGEAFARRLAAEGENIFLVARSEGRLASLCAELGPNNKINAQYFALDLTGPGAAERLFDEAERRGLIVETLINNAGFGSMGDFTEQDLEHELRMIDLNVKTVVELSYRFLPPMRKRGRGAIVNVASTASFQPVPYMATYAATKAFVLSFSEALWEENRSHGLKVMALCPGVTNTGFFTASGMERPPMRAIQEPNEVVDTALRALGRGKSHVVSGWMNYLMIQAERMAPRSLVVRAAGMALRRANNKT
jgi:uncharacterized protein